MFAVIYRGFIYLEKEYEYRKSWSMVAKYFTDHCGALGSTLHKIGEGEYLAYSRWPDKETRDKYWGKSQPTLHPQIEKAIETLKSCLDIERQQPEIQLQVIESVTATNSAELK